MNLASSVDPKLGLGEVKIFWNFVALVGWIARVENYENWVFELRGGQLVEKVKIVKPGDIATMGSWRCLWHLVKVSDHGWTEMEDYHIWEQNLQGQVCFTLEAVVVQ